MPFIDRADAGRRLATLLEHLRGPDVVVVGLPRGGVPVAFEVARALGAPLDVIVVRKLGVPFQPELGMGAIGEGGARVVDERVVSRGRRERRGVRRRGGAASAPSSSAGCGGSGVRAPRCPWRGAPSSSSTTASPPGRQPGPPARWPGPRAPPGWCWPSPLHPPESVATLRRDADEVVCLETPARFFAIGRVLRGLHPDERRRGGRPARTRRARPAADRRPTGVVTATRRGRPIPRSGTRTSRCPPGRSGSRDT